MISVFKPETEFFTGERCHIVEIHNQSGDNGCSIARARVEPGVITQLHALRGIDERYVILEGEGVVEIDGGLPTPVGPLAVVAIPSGKSQRISNVGNSDLLFLCVCTPRFRPDTYINLSDGL